MRQDRPARRAFASFPYQQLSPFHPIPVRRASVSPLRACTGLQRNGGVPTPRVGGAGGGARGWVPEPSPAPPQEAPAQQRPGLTRRRWAQRREHVAPREPSRVSAAGRWRELGGRGAGGDGWGPWDGGQGGGPRTRPSCRGRGWGCSRRGVGTCSCPPPGRAEAGVGPWRPFPSCFHQTPLWAPRDLDPGRPIY